MSRASKILEIYESMVADQYQYHPIVHNAKLDDAILSDHKNILAKLSELERLASKSLPTLSSMLIPKTKKLAVAKELFGMINELLTSINSLEESPAVTAFRDRLKQYSSSRLAVRKRGNKVH